MTKANSKNEDPITKAVVGIITFLSAVAIGAYGYGYDVHAVFGVTNPNLWIAILAGFVAPKMFIRTMAVLFVLQLSGVPFPILH